MADREDIIKRLEAGIAELTSSEAWIAYLDVQRRFHRYSANNVLLIHLQRPEATRVAGFRRWLELGRHVRKGEKGIAILAPIVHRTKVRDEETGEEQVVTGAPRNFRVAHVFDVSQTDGDDLPEAPFQRLSGEDTTGSYTRLATVARSIGYTVEEDFLPAQRNGDCNFVDHRIRIEVSNEPAMQVKTLCHELAHALLHDPAGYTGNRDLAELEAESVAYVVGDGLGLDTGAYSFGYVAGWSGGGAEAIRGIAASAQRISRAARQILDALDAVEQVDRAA